MQVIQISEGKIKKEEATFITQVYIWLASALFITGAIAYWTVSHNEISDLILNHPFLFYGLLISEFICVGFLSSNVKNIDSDTAIATFLGYAALNGLTISTLFLAISSESIASAFFITAITFLIMSVFGHYTKRDLTRFKNLALMGVIGVIVAFTVNIYFENNLTHLIASIIGIILFVVLMARDTQKIKTYSLNNDILNEEDKKEAIHGALTLYLDFLNVFLLMFSIIGRK